MMFNPFMYVFTDHPSLCLLDILIISHNVLHNYVYCPAVQNFYIHSSMSYDWQYDKGTCADVTCKKAILPTPFLKYLQLSVE